MSCIIKKPTKTLSLGEKVKALDLYDKLQSSRKVGDFFGVSKDQIQHLVKRKAEVLDDYNNASYNSKNLHFNMETPHF